MKILAVSGSPRKDKGNTDRLLQPFLAGAREAGAECEVAYLKDKKVKPCQGCFKCWFETPGTCFQKDDMAELLVKLREADVLVCATPLYVCGMSAQMKAFFDRFMPNALPFIELRNGRSTHPSRHERKFRGAVLISNCGFHERFHFDALIAHVKAVIEVGQAEFLGALVRPQGEMLPFIHKLMPAKALSVFGAMEEAGKIVAGGGRVPAEIEDRVAQDFVDLDSFVKAANGYMTAELKKHGHGA